MPEISVIVPQHGRSELTLAAVESLQREHVEEFEVLIVDDGSPVVDKKFLQHRLAGQVVILRIPRRQGVTSAWNRGAEFAAGKYLVFLNNDTFTKGPWLSRLIEPLRQSECLLSGREWRTERVCPVPQRWSSRRILAGWCLATSRETFFSAGMFDEQFKLYFSDTDLQLRLLSRTPNALQAVSELPLTHHGHRSTQRLATRSQEWSADQIRFIRKWHGRKDG